MIWRAGIKDALMVEVHRSLGQGCADDLARDDHPVTVAKQRAELKIGPVPFHPPHDAPQNRLGPQRTGPLRPRRVVKPRDDACLRYESLGDEGRSSWGDTDRPSRCRRGGSIGLAVSHARRGTSAHPCPSPIPEDPVHRYPGMHEAPARRDDVDIRTILGQSLAEGVGMVRFGRPHRRDGSDDEYFHRTEHFPTSRSRTLAPAPTVGD
jgi:hypothetical protein